MIRVTCTACSKAFNVKDDRRGKALVCRCGARIEVPADAPSAAGDDPAATGSGPAAPAAGAAEDAGPQPVSADGDKAEAAPTPEPRAQRLKRPGERAAPAPAPAGPESDPFTPGPEAGGPRARSLAPSGAALKGGLVAALAPPGGGAVLVLWLGLVLLVGSFGLKQILVSWMLAGISDTLETARLGAKQSAAMHDAQAEIEELEIEKRALRAPEDADSDARKKAREEQDEIDKKIEKLQKDVAKDMREIEEDYAEDLLDARGDEKHATAFALRKAQWFLSLKWLLDIAKVLGGALVVFAALGIVTDPEQGSGLKAYATVAAGIALLTFLLGGIVSLLG